MDFIEKWFGLSPDGGDGSLETLYLLVLVIVIGAIMFRARIHELIARHLSERATSTLLSIGALSSGRVNDLRRHL